MNIYDYIDFNYHTDDPTTETAEYCQSIGQTWTPFEMAVIIGRGGCSITERHAAWRELISDYPDMPTIPNSMCPVYESLHSVLRELIAYDECLMSLIKRQEPGAFYEYSIGGEQNPEYYRTRIKFNTFNEAWIRAEKARKSYESKGRHIDYICIDKTYEAPIESEIHSVFDTSGNIIYCRCYPYNVSLLPDIDGGIAEVFYHFQVYIPKPRAKNEYVMLNEDERMLLYAIQKILDEWHPLECWGCPPESDEYNGYTRVMFRILQNGGGEKELNDYWENSGIERENFMTKVKEATKKMLALVKEK
jgi:hypothetical protein